MKFARVAKFSDATRRMSLMRDKSTRGARRNGSFNRILDVPNGTLSGFCDVDRSQDPYSFVRYLDKANSNDQARFTKQQILTNVLHPQKGDHILDVGCGVGHDAQALAGWVGSTGRVIGVDRSTTMIDEAVRRTSSLTLPLEFEIADAYELPFRHKMFDACLVASTFIHLESPKKALAQIRRVLKPGGRLVALEPDWDMLVITMGETEISDAIVRIIRNSVHNSGIGHRLPVLFRQAGFKSITVGAGALMAADYANANNAWRIEESLRHLSHEGAAGRTHAQRLLRRLRAACRKGLFFGASTGFAVSGRKGKN
jgi:ubiquinone/menaquinone biosynthesis C-methylase UbiE